MPVEYMRPTGTRAVTKGYLDRDPGLSPGQAPAVLGMLASGFPDADKFLLKQADALRKFWPDTRFRFEVKAGTDQLNIAIGEPLLSSMAAECDAIVIAWGHCGSCTSGVTRDGILFAERGVPTVTLICDIFWEYSAWLGGALGLTDLPRLMIPFPTAGTDAAHQRAWAERLAPQIVEQLARRSGQSVAAPDSGRARRAVS
jgi:hypothetical protein